MSSWCFGGISGLFFLLFLPAKMSCKLWLNVWTCRSFTCPFTLRNLDRNPTAALISGFIVPRAQRVCIEKATATIRARLLFFSTCLSDCSSPLPRDPYMLALELFLLAFICRGRGEVFSECQDGSVLGNWCLLLVNTGGCGGGPLLPRRPDPPCSLSSSRVKLSEWGIEFLKQPPLLPLPTASTQAAAATTAHQWRAVFFSDEPHIGGVRRSRHRSENKQRHSMKPRSVHILSEMREENKGRTTKRQQTKNVHELDQRHCGIVIGIRYT